MNGDDRKYLMKYLEEKFTNLHKRMDALFVDQTQTENILNKLPCDSRKWQGPAIKGLYWAFVVVMIGGIVLGIWVKATVAG